MMFAKKRAKTHWIWGKSWKSLNKTKKVAWKSTHSKSIFCICTSKTSSKYVLVASEGYIEERESSIWNLYTRIEENMLIFACECVYVCLNWDWDLKIIIKRLPMIQSCNQRACNFFIFSYFSWIYYFCHWFSKTKKSQAQTISSLRNS